MLLFAFRLLIDNGADILAVNNEGEIPVDLAEEKEMEEFLEDEMDKLGIYSSSPCFFLKCIELHVSVFLSIFHYCLFIKNCSCVLFSISSQ